MLAQLIESVRLVSRLAGDDFRGDDRNEFLRRIARVAATLVVLLLVIGIASAQEPAKPTEPLYTVEIVIFRPIAPLGVPEAWSTEADRMQTGASGETETEESQDGGNAVSTRRLSVQGLSSEKFRLAGIDAALQRNRNYEVLSHAGWTQSASARGAGVAVDLAELGTNGQPLRGTVGLERGKYLYLQFDLNYTPADPPASLLSSGNRTAPVTFTLKQKRRVRPFERHYFDHPAFGVIAMISPVK